MQSNEWSAQALAAVEEHLLTLEHPLRVLRGEPMHKHTTMRIGGPADLWIEPTDAAQVAEVVRACRAHGLPLTVVGNGSNLLVRDGGIRGAVLHMGRAMAAYRIEGEQLIAQPGLLMSAAARAAAAAGLAGLVFAEGIPGSVGGGACMNAGAYGGEMSRCIAAVEIADEQGTLRNLQGSALDYGYRHSAMLENRWIITQVTFALTPGDREHIQEEMHTIGTQRRAKQPLKFPSAGSTFKRPQGHFASQLIDGAGLKGTRIGGAQVSTQHAGFLINVDHATGRDMQALITHVQRRVWEHAGVRLEPEVRIIGEEA